MEQVSKLASSPRRLRPQSDRSNVTERAPADLGLAPLPPCGRRENRHHLTPKAGPRLEETERTGVKASAARVRVRTRRVY